MELFIGALVVGVLVWRWFKRLKHAQFIQATEYLWRLENGSSIDEANGAALSLFANGKAATIEDELAEQRALMFAPAQIQHKRNLVVLAAKEKGFIG